MKKIICSCILTVALLGLLITGCSRSSSESETSKDTKIEAGHTICLNEVAHSIFYAPMYVAIENGYFQDNGIELELKCGYGADKTMTAVLSGEADIGFMGGEATIYAYQEGASDIVTNFAQLTQRAGNFLVAKENTSDFKWSDLKGKTILGGRKGGMPEMVFEYILKENKIDPTKDLTINQSIDFGSTAAAFSGGQGDYTVEFEPSATKLELQKAGYVVASLGVDSGYVPYTSFCAKSSYIKENKKWIQKFTDALQDGMDYCKDHSSAEIAQVIKPQFPDTKLSTLEKIVDRYHQQDTWKENLIYEKDSFELLKKIIQSAGELKTDVPYEKLITTEFAKKAVQ